MFMDYLQSVLFNPHIDYNIRNSDVSIQTCQKVLHNHVPWKKNNIRRDHKPFMNKKISKSIMQRTGFRNKFLKNPSNESRHIYTKQH